MAGAAHLAQAGHQVTLIEPAPELGHATNGFSWNGYCLDYGCHLFGNETRDASALLYTLLDGRVRALEPRTGAWHHGELRTNTELPDLRNLAEPGLGELIAASLRKEPAPSNLQAWLQGRYGETVSETLSGVCQKLFRIRANELDVDAQNAGPFRRVTLTDDPLARALKQLPALDDRLAVRSSRGGREFYPEAHPEIAGRSFYPAEGGMRGFSLSGKAVLSGLGVKLRLGEIPLEIEQTSDGIRGATDLGGSFQADELLWCNGAASLEPLTTGAKRLEERVHRVPLVLFYFPIDKAQAGSLSYVHCFDDDMHLYRASLPGEYAEGSCPPSRSYLCCEVPTELGSALFQNPESFAGRIFDEARQTEIVSGRAPSTFLAKPLRSSYKLPKRGYGELSDELRMDLANTQIHVPREWAFSSSASVRSVLAALNPAE